MDVKGNPINMDPARAPETRFQRLLEKYAGKGTMEPELELVKLKLKLIGAYSEQKYQN